MKTQNLLKKFLVTLLIVVLGVATLAGCSSSKKNDGGQKTVKVGVILYNYTDIQGKEIKNYCDNYLAKNFPVKFEYQTATANDNDAHLAAVDALISRGVNAIISGYDTVIGASMEKCDKAGVYYGVLLGEAKNEADKDGKYNQYGNWGTAQQSNLYYSDYFLGGIYQFGADHGLALGKTYGDAVAKAGAKKVGAISFPAFAFADGVVISQGFTDAVKGAGSAIADSTGKNGGLPQEANFTSVGADTKAYIAKYPDMDALFGLSSGMDMVLPAVNESGRLWTKANTGAGKIKIASLGYNESSKKYLTDGTLLIGGTNNYVQSVAYLFTLMFDAVNGHNWKKDTASGFQMNAAINYPTFTNEKELGDFETYVLTTVNNDLTKVSVSADELKKVMKAYNGNESWKDLQTLVSRNVDQIKEARK